jgi:hypothetical protein
MLRSSQIASKSTPDWPPPQIDAFHVLPVENPGNLAYIFGQIQAANNPYAGLAGSAAVNIGCGTMLPNGQTVGDVIRQQRALLKSVVDNALTTSASGNPSNPLGEIMGAFYPIAEGNDPIDFKNNFPTADRNTMGLSGNFAYCAIGGGILPTSILNAGAGAYALKAAFTGHFSVFCGFDWSVLFGYCRCHRTRSWIS